MQSFFLYICRPTLIEYSIVSEVFSKNILSLTSIYFLQIIKKIKGSEAVEVWKYLRDQVFEAAKIASTCKHNDTRHQLLNPRTLSPTAKLIIVVE